MQSQQKKVKWSRGETADALEERTDTGITQVSVSKLENIIADVYGNISRRPAFKIIESVDGATDLPIVEERTTSGDDYNNTPQYFVFTIDANKYIFFIKPKYENDFAGLLIQDGKFVKKVNIINNVGYLPQSQLNDIQISVAQYNNFMVVSNLFPYDVIFRLTEDNDIIVERFQFSAPWYAPAGTQTKTVSDQELPGLEFNKDGMGFTHFAWTDASGNSSPYSNIDTGIDGDIDKVAEVIPIGSIVKFPSLGAYMRVEGYQLGSHNIYYSQYIFDNAEVESIDTTGLCVTVWSHRGHEVDEFDIKVYRNGKQFGTIWNVNRGWNVWVQCSASQTGFKRLVITEGAYPERFTASWVDATPEEMDVQMFGALLTPVAKADAKDTTVTVEYGYISLNTYQPTKFVFSNQRLFAGGFYNEFAAQKHIPGYAVGSQIGKYTDFKNDFNTQAEAVVIDISTHYQEQVVALVDYNGLKILTDTAEYSYSAQNGVVKQSENGALATCSPLVFGSVCLYADKSGNQIRAMQYELQNDLFQSSSINLLAKEDLIFNTTAMAGFLDKEHYNGRFLYAVQSGYNSSWTPIASHSIAVCNMMPGNQTMIWTRWTSPELKTARNNDEHSIVGTLEINNKVWFVLKCGLTTIMPSLEISTPCYTIAELDYDNRCDLESVESADSTVFKLSKKTIEDYLYAWETQTTPSNLVYTKTAYEEVAQGDGVYDKDGQQISVVDNNPGGPAMVIDGVPYYAWTYPYSGNWHIVYTKSKTPDPLVDDNLYDSNGDAYTDGRRLLSYDEEYNRIEIVLSDESTHWAYFVPTPMQYTIDDVQYSATESPGHSISPEFLTMPRATVSVFDGDEYKWDDTLDEYGNYTKPLTDLTNPRVGFMINATLESHPIDIQGKTYTEKKRIGKAVAVIRNTEPGAFTVCDKTGYTAPDKKTVNFYGCTGMKEQIRYTIKNIQGAKFTIESLTMIIEYGTLDS